MKRCWLLLLAVMVLLTGCEGIDVSRLLDHELPTRIPEITASSLARSTPTFNGPATCLRIYEDNTVVGDVMDSSMANQLFWAAQDDTCLLTDEAGCSFDRKVEILDDKNTVLAQVMVASDGCRYATRSDGQVMMVPEYTYYGLEYGLWNAGKSLASRTFTYEPEEDSDVVLDIRMQQEIPVLLRQRYGYADGYFCRWEIYEVAREKETVSVYVQLYYGLYTLSEESFSPMRRGNVALRLTYDWVEEDIWQLGSAKFSDDSVKDSQIQSAVRNVFSFELTRKFMQKYNDTELMEQDIMLQAKEYLRQRGMGRMTIDD